MRFLGVHVHLSKCWRGAGYVVRERLVTPDLEFPLAHFKRLMLVRRSRFSPILENFCIVSRHCTSRRLVYPKAYSLPLLIVLVAPAHLSSVHYNVSVFVAFLTTKYRDMDLTVIHRKAHELN